MSNSAIQFCKEYVQYIEYLTRTGQALQDTKFLELYAKAKVASQGNEIKSAVTTAVSTTLDIVEEKMGEAAESVRAKIDYMDSYSCKGFLVGIETAIDIIKVAKSNIKEIDF